MRQKHREFLNRIDFLEGASDELLHRISGDVEPLSLARGSEIFPDEVSGDAMYFIVEGDVGIEKNGQRLVTRRAGEYVGEMALVDDAPRSAAAVAASEVSLLRWGRDEFRDALHSEGRIAYQVCRAFCKKIREDVEQVSKFQQDLERAALIQKAMLPEETFSHDRLELVAYCLQTDRSGGDLYDYLPFSDDRIALLIADAQGHGFPAALLVSMLKSRWHSRASRNADPAHVMSALNQTLLKHLDAIHTATCFYAVLDVERRELRWCSAGHIPQYLYRTKAEKLEKLSPGDGLLGFFERESSAYHVRTERWEPGDLLVLCTDGVTEAENAAEEEFGRGRLRELILRHHHRDLHDMQRHLIEGVRSFRGDAPFFDDVTLVVVRLL